MPCSMESGLFGEWCAHRGEDVHGASRRRELVTAVMKYRSLRSKVLLRCSAVGRAWLFRSGGSARDTVRR